MSSQLSAISISSSSVNRMKALTRSRRSLKFSSAYWTELHKDLDDFHLEDFNPAIEEVMNKIFMNVLKDSCIPEEDESLENECNLAMLPFKARRIIWANIPPAQLPSIRHLSKLFQQDIDQKYGTQFIYDESLPSSIEWAKSVAISKLIVRKMIRSITEEDTLLPHKKLCLFVSPKLLQSLQIDGPISASNLHYILDKCCNIQEFSIKMSYFHLLKECRELFPPPSNRNAFTSSANGTGPGSSAPVPVLPYRSFDILQSLKIISILNENCDNFISATVEPISQNIRSPYFTSLQLWIKCDFIQFIELLNLVEKCFFANDLKVLNLHLPGPPKVKDTSKPQPQEDDEDSSTYHSSPSNRTFPTNLSTLVLQDMSRLQVTSTRSKLILWKDLMLVQTGLVSFSVNIGPTFWKDYKQVVQTCSGTLKELSLHQLTIQQESSQSKEIEPFDFGIFEHCKHLISLKLIAVIRLEDHQCQLSSTSTSTRSTTIPSISNVSKLPPQIISIHLEHFKFTATEIFSLHCSCPALRYLTLEYWNPSKMDLETSVSFIEHVLKERKYKICTFLDWKELTWYSNGEVAAAGYDGVRSKRHLKSNVRSSRSKTLSSRSRCRPRGQRQCQRQNYFNELIANLKKIMIGNVKVDNSFAFGIELTEINN